MFQTEPPRSWIPAFAGMTDVGERSLPPRKRENDGPSPRSLPPRKRGSDGPKKAIGARKQGAAPKARHSHETRHPRLLPVTLASSPSPSPPPRHSRLLPCHSRESGNPSRSTPSGAPRFDVFEVRRAAKRPLHDAYMANTSPPRHVSKKRFRREAPGGGRRAHAAPLPASPLAGGRSLSCGAGAAARTAPLVPPPSCRCVAGARALRAGGRAGRRV